MAAATGNGATGNGAAWAEVGAQGRPQAEGTRGDERWRCISGCGCCCRLDPSLRPEALEALSESQRATYLRMVGGDGWCIHFDTGGRRCRIYASRPDFCRVSSLIELFGQRGADGNALAIACCKQQIRSEDGGRGKVLRRFLRAIRRPR